MRCLVRSDFRVYVMYRKTRGRMQEMHDSRAYIRYVHFVLPVLWGANPTKVTHAH